MTYSSHRLNFNKARYKWNFFVIHLLVDCNFRIRIGSVIYCTTAKLFYIYISLRRAIILSVRTYRTSRKNTFQSGKGVALRINCQRAVCDTCPSSDLCLHNFLTRMVHFYKPENSFSGACPLRSWRKNLYIIADTPPGTNILSLVLYWRSRLVLILFGSSIEFFRFYFYKFLLNQAK